MTDFVTGDTGSKIRVTCSDTNGDAMNITGATVTLIWENAAGTITTKTMTHVDDVGGVAEYQFAANELFAPKMKFEVEVKGVDNKVVTSLDVIEAVVREQIGSAP